MSNDTQIETRKDLAKALTSVKTAEEMERFLVDLCTPAELRALAERWHVAQILDVEVIAKSTP